MGVTREPERRRAARFQGDRYPLRIGPHAARLVDWSAQGVGVQLKEAGEDMRVGVVLTLSVHSDLTGGVAVFPVVVRRIDAARRIIGVEFLTDSAAEEESAARFLAGLLGRK